MNIENARERALSNFIRISIHIIVKKWKFLMAQKSSEERGHFFFYRQSAAHWMFSDTTQPLPPGGEKKTVTRTREIKIQFSRVPTILKVQINYFDSSRLSRNIVTRQRLAFLSIQFCSCFVCFFFFRFIHAVIIIPVVRCWCIMFNGIYQASSLSARVCGMPVVFYVLLYTCTLLLRCVEMGQARGILYYSRNSLVSTTFIIRQKLN